MYFVDRLTATKPNWQHAIIYSKGVEAFGLRAEGNEIRYDKEAEILIVSMKGIQDPFDPPHQGTRTGPNPQDVTPPHLGSMVDSEIHFHIQEIVRIEFLTNRREIKPVIPKKTSTILTAEGEIAEPEEKKKKNNLKSIKD